VKRCLFLLMCIISMVGCSQESTSPKQSGKMLPPIKAKLEVEEESLSNDIIQLTLRITFENSETKAKAILEESGAIQIAEVGKTVLGEWSNLQKGEAISIPIDVKAKGNGKGSIKVRVEAYDENGKLKYGMNPSQYFLVSEEEVLTGNNGFMDLEIQHLDHLKEQGKISNKEYEKRKEEIMKGN